LGGALATIATHRLQDMQSGQIATYTFGQPRVGGKKLAEQIASYEFYRFAHISDPVSLLPPEWMHYFHGGTLKQIDINGKIHTLASTTHNTITKVAKFLGSSPKTFIKNRIESHRLSNYIVAIENAIVLGNTTNSPRKAKGTSAKTKGISSQTKGKQGKKKGGRP